MEIAKALSKNVRLLILDEPTSSLNETDAQRLLDLLVKLKAEGMTSIIISHKLNELEQISDKLTILRDGRTIETLDRRDGRAFRRANHPRHGRTRNSGRLPRQKCYARSDDV